MKKNDNLATKPKFEEDRLDLYSDLLIRRDQLFKEAASLQIAYTREFGEQLIENFELKVECIRMKKNISYCRRMLNRGLQINVNAMNEAVDKEMALYKMQLADLKGEYRRSRESKPAGEYEYMRCKKIYRRLSKLIHPDVNAATGNNDELRDLWERITNAYHANDLEGLEELEVLVRRALEELGDEAFDMDIEDLEDRIERVETQINEIITTEPYTFSEILEDDEKKKSLHDQLSVEHSDYEEYLETLKKALNELLLGKGMNTTWEMN